MKKEKTCVLTLISAEGRQASPRLDCDQSYCFPQITYPA